MCPNPQLIVINSFEMAGDKKVVALQEKLSTETEKFRGLQKDLQKCLASAQQLEAQLKENEVVKEELGLVKDDSKVYKLIGPVLVKQVCDISKKLSDFLGLNVCTALRTCKRQNIVIAHGGTDMSHNHILPLAQCPFEKILKKSMF